jgi:hypothetical protein
MEEKEQLKSLKWQLKAIKKHLKWCKDNNKPQEHLDVHIEVIKEIKEDIKKLKISKNL